MINQYVIQPYAVGREKRSLAMILPSEIVKSYNIDPRTAFLILRVNGIDDLHLKIIREEDLIKKDPKNWISAEKVPRLEQQISISED